MGGGEGRERKADRVKCPKTFVPAHCSFSDIFLAKSVWILFPAQFSIDTDKDTNQSKRKPRLFVLVDDRAVWNVLDGVSMFMILFTWLQNSGKVCSVHSKSAMAKTRLSRRTFTMTLVSNLG